MKTKKNSLGNLIYMNLIATTFIAILVILILSSTIYFSSVSRFAASVSETVTDLEIKKNESIIEKQAELISLNLFEMESMASMLQRATTSYYKNFHTLYNKIENQSLEDILTNPNFYSNFLQEGVPEFEIHENGSTYKSSKFGGALYYSADSKLGKLEYSKAISSEFLDVAHKSIVDTNPLITQAYLNTWDNMNRIYPYIDEISVQYGSTLAMKNHNFYYEADPEHNPEKKPVWTDAYLDPAGQGWMVSCVFPIYYNDFLEGVSGLDVTIDSFISNLFDNKLPEYTSLFILSSDGSILAMDENIEKLFNLKELKSHDYVTDIDYTLLKPQEYVITQNKSSDLIGTVGTMFSLNVPFEEIKTDDKNYLIRQKEIAKLGWRLFTITDKEKLLEPITDKKERFDRAGYLSLISFSVLYFIFIVLLFNKSRKIAQLIIQPIKKLSDQTKSVAKNLSNDQLVESKIYEIDTLNKNFKQMADELQERTDEIIKIEVERQKKIKEAELHYKNSITDSLTSLFNRLKIDEILEYEIHQSKRYGNPLSLIFIDIDNFKLINDTFGHAVGDEVLISFAELLKDNLRYSDSAGRWGGEEFILVCTNTSLYGAVLLAEKLRKAVETHDFATAGHQTASFGIAEFELSDNRRSLITKADQAMYEAKRTSKNVVKTYFDLEKDSSDTSK